CLRSLDPGTGIGLFPNSCWNETGPSTRSPKANGPADSNVSSRIGNIRSVHRQFRNSSTRFTSDRVRRSERSDQGKKPTESWTTCTRTGNRHHTYRRIVTKIGEFILPD